MKTSDRRWWDFPSTVLLFLTLITSAARLTFTGWTPDLGPIGPLTTIGLILGLALGLSHFRKKTTWVLALLYSLVVIPWAFAEFLYERVDFLFRFNNLGERLINSIHLLVNQQPVEDTLLFALILSVLFWIISLLAGYTLTRYASFLATTLPAGIVAFLVQLSDSSVLYRIGFLIAFLFFALLLLGRLNYIRKRSYWKEHNIFQQVESGSALNGAIVLAAFVLIMIVSLTPSPEKPIGWLSNLWNSVTEPLDASLEGLSNITAGLQGSKGIPTYNYYGDTLGLGQQASTSEELLFRISIPPTPLVSRYYWRIRTYDVYAQSQWSSSFNFTQTFSPDIDA